MLRSVRLPFARRDAGERRALAGGLRLVARSTRGERDGRKERHAGDPPPGTAGGGHGERPPQHAGSSDNETHQNLVHARRIKPKPGRVRPTTPHLPVLRAWWHEREREIPDGRPARLPIATNATAATSATTIRAAEAPDRGSRGPKASTADAASSSVADKIRDARAHPVWQAAHARRQVVGEIRKRVGEVRSGPQQRAGQRRPPRRQGRTRAGRAPRRPAAARTRSCRARPNTPLTSGPGHSPRRGRRQQREPASRANPRAATAARRQPAKPRQPSEPLPG